MAKAKGYINMKNLTAKIKELEKELAQTAKKNCVIENPCKKTKCKV